MTFEPIAIVGRSCVLPGAFSPDELWRVVSEGRDVLTPVPEGRWRLRPELALAAAEETGRAGVRESRTADRTVSDRGGYVSGFERVFDPTGFEVPERDIQALDPLFHWVLHTAREALRDAFGGLPVEAVRARTGLILGNLSFPTDSMARFAESVLLGSSSRAIAPDPRNRFQSGLPAHLAARGLGLLAGAFALDAACASSLYAIKLACDRLADGTADLMLAGAVNRADDLFLHVGFTALHALSPTGRSRPFHRAADGLVPAEGAAMVALTRLSFAIAQGLPIHGVIRGVGLSNDGRGAGLLSPSWEGQARAMRLAYHAAGIAPADVSLLECHATGTPVGDGAEIQSTAQIFQGLSRVPIGSIKSNMGHLITVAGAAALLKVLAAMRHGIRPPTLHAAQEPLPVLQGSPFRLLGAAEPWETPGPRIAGISAFGFGGNNAHLIVEEWPGSGSGCTASRNHATATRAGVGADEQIAVVALGIRAAECEGVADFTRRLVSGKATPRRIDSVSLASQGLRFPPRDLGQTLAQQLLVLAAAREAVEAAGPLPRETTAVLVGMQCDGAVARFGLRWRLPELLPTLPKSAIRRLMDDVTPALTSPGVVGAMPNIVANRLNSQFDFGGPSFTVSSEELSGTRALEVAVRALRAREIDTAVVGAVDVGCEPVHQGALRAVLDPQASEPGDAAVVLVVKRLGDARRDGNSVLAILNAQMGGSAAGTETLPAGSVAALFGHAHSAAGLLDIAAAVLAQHHQFVLGGMAAGGGVEPARPWLPAGSRRVLGVHTAALGGQSESTYVASGAPETSSGRLFRESRAAPLLEGDPPSFHVFSGADRAGLLRALAAGNESDVGPARLVVVAQGEANLRDRLAAARAFLEQAHASSFSAARGLAYCERPTSSELAFVFTGPAGAYRGMGKDLLLAFPGLVAALSPRFSDLHGAAGWIYRTEPGEDVSEPSAVDKLWGSSFLCQAHAVLTREVLGLKPQAAIGFCSGETNALFAFSAWNDVDAMRDEIERAEIYTRELGGSFDAVRLAWGEGSHVPIAWKSWRVLAPMERVRGALANEPRVHLAIVNAPGDVVISGDAAGCERVVESVGRERCRPLGYDVAVHCPELSAFAQEWRRLHTRETTAVEGVRFYTHATLSAYSPDAQSAADALLGQALRTVDFPALIERAYEDGVRVFLEHGPQGGCSRWIQRILGDREHVAVSLDLPGVSPLERLTDAVAQLLAAGVALDHRALTSLLGPAYRGARHRRAEEASRDLVFPVHPSLSGFTSQLEALEREAPRLAQEIERPPVSVAAMSLPGALRTGASSATSRAWTAVAETHARVVALHRAFVESQANVHESFLATRLIGPLGAERSAARSPVPTPQKPARRESISQDVPPQFPGPYLSRVDLERLASGRISEVFGPLFRQQDSYRRQVRMPEPPLLLADRVLGIRGEPTSMGKGTIWTETDVAWSSWYLVDGRMPAGIAIECGQADLLLISWLGVDLLNRGERVYRLLGCDLTYHALLAKPGETLRYEIHVDGHACQGDVRLFFFHYDATVDGERRMSVREGQAGFFTDEELRNTGGILWSPEEATPLANARLDPPPLRPDRSSFSKDAVRAFAEGRLTSCFGEPWAMTQTHVRTPRIPADRLLLLGDVTHLDPSGGPWRRGYLRSVLRFSPDDWFFDGHFKEDPCMPGTLMFEGCLQAMAFYLAALGTTLDKDGWRFEPVTGETYRLRCRGQATPQSQELVTELFVEEFHAGRETRLYADLLCTVDGVKAFHCRRMGLRLSPDWPLESRPELVHEARASRRAPAVPPLVADERAVLACAIGRPSDAFGKAVERFDGPRRLPRLPGPPFLFLSRIVGSEGELGALKSGVAIHAEYDVPPDAWYFAEGGSGAMPYPVLLEAALQPCGWLALRSLAAELPEHDLYFRNLDGVATQTAEVFPNAGVLSTRVTLTNVSRTGGIVLVSFDVRCALAGRPVFSMKTGFGFFPKAALEAQAGLAASPEEREAVRHAGSSQGVDVLEAKAPPGLRLPKRRLRMLDRVTHFDKSGGRLGLGSLRAEKDISKGQWFFAAHFYQDPVQPGSLGLAALLQALQLAMREAGLDAGIPEPRFAVEVLHEATPLTWRYRGQVLPTNRRVTVLLELTRIERGEKSVFASADGSLWVDGVSIYRAEGLSMRIVSSREARP